MTPLEIANFWTRVEPGPPNMCWPWKGRKNEKGYGRWAGTMAHRTAYELVNGPVPEGLIVRHRCDNPCCCNPGHLLAGTSKENTQDALDRKRFALGEKHGRTKLREDQARYIMTNPDRKTGKALAEEFGVSRSTVSYIQSGRSWSRLVGVAGIEPASPPCQGGA